MKQQHWTNKILYLGCLLLVTILAQLPAAAVVRAGDVSVTAELSPREFPLNEAAQLTITVNGSRSARPEQPSGDGLQFTYRGQNSRTQWINGKISSSVSFVFMVMAEQTGTRTISPIKVTVDGREYMTEAITCTVLSAKGSTGPQTGGKSLQQGQAKAPSARLRSGEAEKIGFMRITPDKEKIYSGQLVPFSVKAYFRQGMRVTLKSNPRFIGDNFILQSIDDKPRQREVTINGERYIALTWQGTLSAVKEGTFPLEMEMDAELLVRTQRRQNNPLGSSFLNDPFFDDFFGQYSRRQVKVASPEKNIVVMDLPAEGRPADFHGAIGTFSLAVAAAPLQGKIGDPITLKMVIYGSGNFDMVHAPAITDTNGWKTYPATDSFEERSPDSGKKIFEQAIVPTSSGLSAIPPVQFSYFDPEAAEYVTLVSDPIDIQLTKPTGSSALTDSHGDNNPASVQQDTPNHQTHYNLAPLHTEPGRLVQTIKPLYQKNWFLLLAAAAVLCLMASLLLYLRRKKLEGDPTILRHKEVNQQLKELYQEMEKAIRMQDQDGFCNHCRKAIQLRLGEKWELAAPAITLADLQQRLAADAPLLDIFSRIEHAGYSGNRLDQATLEQMLQTTQQELDRLP